MIPVVPFPPFTRFRPGVPNLFGYPRMAFVFTVQQKYIPASTRDARIEWQAYTSSPKMVILSGP
jgi:hypothetical protein